MSRFSVLEIDKWILPKPWPVEAVQVPRYQAHRGHWSEAIPENSLKSLIEAKRQGLFMSEIDVRLSRDGVPVLSHDRSLQRIFGINQNVSQLDFSELAKIGVDSLESVLQNPDCCQFLNIELKSTSAVQDKLERMVAQVIKKQKADRRVYFSSFNPFSLWRMANYLPQIPRALLVSDQLVQGNNIFLRKKILAPFIPLHALHLQETMISEEVLRKYSSQKLPIAIWTVSSAQKAETYFKWGAWSVISEGIGVRRR
jgi:glycerophosphoryl diester phosphodiesterase